MVGNQVVLTDQLVRDMQRSTSHDGFWRSYLQNLTASGPNSFAVHLAVLVEPYLRFILDGKKTVESRFSKRRVAPYGVVRTGDVILLKRASAKGLRGICVVSNVWHYRLTPDGWDDIRNEYTEQLCAHDPQFWESRRGAKFATLMRVSEATYLPIIDFSKRDRRGWAILRPKPPAIIDLGLETSV